MPSFLIRTIRPAVALTLAAATLGGGHLAAQQTRTLGAGGAPVTIDFLAVDANGAPVTDLKATDVAIRINGKVRTIQSLNVVKMDTTPAAAPAPAAPAPAAPASSSSPASPASEHDAPVADTALPPPFGTNAHAVHGPGRAIFLVVDNESIKPSAERSVQAAIDGMLNTLSAQDQVALVTVPHGGVNIELTNDLAKVRQGVQTLKAQAPGRESVSDATARSRNSLLQFTSMMQQLEGADKPSTFVFISTSLLGPQTTSTANSSTQQSGNTGSSSLNGDLTADDFNYLTPAASSARAEVYVVQPEGGATPISSASAAPTNYKSDTSSSTTTDPTVGLQDVAGGTGGAMFQMALANETALARISHETSAYYVATLDPEPEDRTGTTHSLSIKTTRSDVTIRTTPAVGGAAKAAAGPAAKPVTPDDKIKTTAAFRDVQLRVTAFAIRKSATDAKMTVQAIAEPIDPATHFNALTFVLVDETTHKVAGLYKAQPAQLSASPVIGLFEVPAGNYRLRAAATDAAGHAGAADYALDAELTTGGPYKLSTVALGVSDASGHFQQATEFSSAPEATVYCELYGKIDPKISLMVELAKTPGGKALDLDLKPQGAPSNEADKVFIIAKVPLSGLAPGDYVVRVKFGVLDQPGGTVLRTLRKIAQ